MRAVILAAGYGRRLRPLTESLPKALLQVAGRPLIEYPLRFLHAQGIEEVIINLHDRGDMVAETLGDGRRYGIKIIYSREETLLDTGGAIKKAQGLLEDDTFIVINGDTLLDLPLADVLDFHRRHRATATMVLRPDSETHRYGVIEVDAARRIRRFLGTPAHVSGHLVPFMFASLHILEPQVFAFMPPQETFSIRDTYVQMLLADQPLYGFPFFGFWMTVDTPAELARAHTTLSTSQPLSFLAPS